MFNTNEPIYVNIHECCAHILDFSIQNIQEYNRKRFARLGEPL
jgi:hypothetical protein